MDAEDKAVHRVFLRRNWKRACSGNGPAKIEKPFLPLCPRPACLQDRRPCWRGFRTVALLARRALLFRAPSALRSSGLRVPAALPRCRHVAQTSVAQPRHEQSLTSPLSRQPRTQRKPQQRQAREAPPGQRRLSPFGFSTRLDGGAEHWGSCHSGSWGRVPLRSAAKLGKRLWGHGVLALLLGKAHRSLRKRLLGARPSWPLLCPRQRVVGGALLLGTPGPQHRWLK